MLVDSHAHLQMPEFQDDREQVIAQARQNDIGYILNVAIDLQALRLSQELAEKHGFIYLAAGIHPHNSAEVDFTEFQSQLEHAKLVGIGEIGLDFFRDYAPREKQEEVFRLCLREAKQKELPVIIHQRKAQAGILRILKEELNPPMRGVMHCFSGDLAWAEECIRLGFLISFAGNITYPKADSLRQVAAAIPLKRILVETDCPWLAPQQFRGKRCEPAHVRYVAEEIAKVKGISDDEVAAVTGENFKRLFKIGK